MLQSGNLIIQSGTLNPGNLQAQTGTFSSGNLSGPTTYISVEYDPVFTNSPAGSITQEDIDKWNAGTDLSTYVTYNYLNSCSYATNQYVTETVNNAIEGLDIDVDLSSYVTYQFLSAQSYISSIPSEYVTEDELAQALLAYATKNYVDQKILEAEIGGGDVTIDLTDYLRKDELPSYLSSYLTEADLSAKSYVTQQYLSSCGYLTQHQSLADYPTYAYTDSHYPSYAYVINKINEAAIGGDIDLSAYVTHQFLESQAYLTSVPAGYATEAYVTNAIAGIEPVTYETVSYATYNTSTSIWQGTYAQYNLLPDHITYQLYLIAAE